MAIDFLGTDEYLNCASGASLDDLAAKSVAAWVYYDALPDNNYSSIVTKGSPDYWTFGFSDLAALSCVNCLHFWQGYATNGVWRTANNTVAAGAWNHYAVTLSSRSDTAANPIIYINGVSTAVTEQQTPAGAARSDAAQNLLIAYDAAGAYPNAKMEDVRVFNRVLTANEVAILAAGYRGPLGGEVLWLPMDTARGVYDWDGRSLAAANILHDQSGNKNHGTPSGTPLGEVI